MVKGCRGQDKGRRGETSASAWKMMLFVCPPPGLFYASASGVENTPPLPEHEKSQVGHWCEGPGMCCPLSLSSSDCRAQPASEGYREIMTRFSATSHRSRISGIGVRDNNYQKEILFPPSTYFFSQTHHFLCL